MRWLILACLCACADSETDSDTTSEDSGPVGLPLDLDNDGYTVAQGDCHDEDPTINPGALEDCGPIDRDCDDDPYGDAVVQVAIYRQNEEQGGAVLRQLQWFPPGGTATPQTLRPTQALDFRRTHAFFLSANEVLRSVALSGMEGGDHHVRVYERNASELSLLEHAVYGGVSHVTSIEHLDTANGAPVLAYTLAFDEMGFPTSFERTLPALQGDSFAWDAARRVAAHTLADPRDPSTIYRWWFDEDARVTQWEEAIDGQGGPLAVETFTYNEDGSVATMAIALGAEPPSYQESYTYVDDRLVQIDALEQDAFAHRLNFTFSCVIPDHLSGLSFTSTKVSDGEEVTDWEYHYGFGVHGGVYP